MNRLPLLVVAAGLWAAAQAVAAEPPGVIVDRSPDFAKVYVGCPSIALLPDGGYVASHSWFGPGTNNDTSEVFASADRGQTWRHAATLKGQWWSTLFVHRGGLYIIGVSRQYGEIVIRRSADGGKTWTEPKDEKSGRLFEGKFHCAPVPVIVHGGRIWRAFELAEGKRPAWSALVLSAPEGADLLGAAAWQMSEKLQHLWSKSQWIEGNMVVAPDGKLVNVLRTGGAADRGAIVHVSDDGRQLTHDRNADLIDLPGGGSKFTIRFDPQSKRYWTIGNKQSDPPAGRNVLALASSADLRSWKVDTILLRHTDMLFHAWQYVDWQFDGADIVAVSRTAWDGSHNYHDANYLTFHRIVNFRTQKMADAPPVLRQAARCETADFTVTGFAWTPATLADDRKAFANRNYVWKNVPEKFRHWQVTQTSGGVPAEIRVQARRAAQLFAATTGNPADIEAAGWTAVADAAFNYTDKNQATLKIYSRALKAGEEFVVPPSNWAGMIVLLPGPHAANGAAPSGGRGGLWMGSTDLSRNANIPWLDARHLVIDECTAGEYQFTLGADIVFHNGEFVAQWANSRVDENDEHTLVRGRRSPDAVTWSGREVIAPGFEGPGFHSHGVFLSHAGSLWSFNSEIRQRPELRGFFAGLCTDAFRWRPETKRWEPQSLTGLEGFWPLGKPAQLGNGQWIMAGARNAPKTVLAAVALCGGNDFTRWRLVTIPHPADLEPDQIWGETTVTVEGPRVLAVVRNRKKGGTGFWYSISPDHGQTWPALCESNIPAGGGRPMLGRLADGRHFLVGNMRTRNTLVLAVSRPGTFEFDRMYRLIDRPSPPIRMPPAGAKRSQWAYPSAVEHQGKLYVVYSITKEATGLTVVDLAAMR